MSAEPTNPPATSLAALSESLTPPTSATAPYGSELERRAAEIRAQRAQERGERERFTAQQNAEHASFSFALSLPCPEHNAAPGKPLLAAVTRRSTPPRRQGRLRCSGAS